MLHAKATHRVCVLRLADTNDPYKQDYVDDGEFGGGRCILKFLTERDLTNKAIFIVRFYGGVKLGG